MGHAAEKDAVSTLEIAVILGGHQPVQFSLISEHGPWHLTCSCEQWTCDCEDPMSMEDGACLTNDEHRNHVADAICAYVTPPAETGGSDA